MVEARLDREAGLAASNRLRVQTHCARHHSHDEQVYRGSSGGMEAAGVVEVLEHFAKHTAVMTELKLMGICVDKDSTTTETLMNSALLRNIAIYYDPGHVKKGFVKSLEKIFSRIDYQRIPHRMGARFMSLIKQAEAKYPNNPAAMQQEWLASMVNFTAHYTDQPCGALCTGDKPCPWSLPGADKRNSGTAKYFLDMSVPAEAAMMEKVEALLLNIRLRVRQFLHGYNTCCVESAHRQRVAHAVKDNNYYATFEGRCYQTVCWHHLGPGALPAILEKLGLPMQPEQLADVEAWTEQHFNRRKNQMSEAVRKRRAQRTAAQRTEREADKIISAEKRHAY